MDFKKILSMIKKLKVFLPLWTDEYEKQLKHLRMKTVCYFFVIKL